MERYTHAYPAALNDDDNVGFRTKGSEYIHKAHPKSVHYTQLHITNVCDGRWMTTLTEAA